MSELCADEHSCNSFTQQQDRTQNSEAKKYYVTYPGKAEGAAPPKFL